MKPIAQLTNQTLETLASLPTRESKEEKPPLLLPDKINNPCETEWQRKWLALDCHHPKVQAMAEKAQAFCARWFSRNPNPSLLVLVGESGCGKTHVANAVLMFCYKAGMTAFDAGAWTTKGTEESGHVTKQNWLSWPETSDAFKSGDYSAIPDAIGCGLLVVDDIGAEHDPSKNATDKLCQILSRREKRFTIVTTNIKAEEWADRFDSRICDRLLRNSEIVDLFGVESFATI